MYCRPVISVDGTFLTNKYRGTLLIAVVMDGNNHIFPIAFAIVDSENDVAWQWFFEHLRNAIGDCNGIVIVSDRNSSIAKAIATVFPLAHHGICMQHLLNNVKKKYKSGAIDPLFYRCAKAYTRDEYEYYMESLCSINGGIKKYLTDSDPTRWARSHFISKRYNIMTTNISECLNAVLKESRNCPIVALVDSFRVVLQRWFYEHRVEGISTRSNLTKWAEDLMEKQEDLARTMKVIVHCYYFYTRVLFFFDFCEILLNISVILFLTYRCILLVHMNLKLFAMVHKWSLTYIQEAVHAVFGRLRTFHVVMPLQHCGALN